MPNRHISIFIVSVPLIQLLVDVVLSDVGDSAQYSNGGSYNLGGSFNNYQPTHQSVPQPLPQKNYPDSYPYYPYALPTVISLDGKNNKNSNGSSSNYNSLLNFLTQWVSSQSCPVYVPYPIPIPVPCMSDGDESWREVFNPEKFEENGWVPGSSAGSISGQSSRRKRKRGRSKRRGQSAKKSNSNTQNSRSSPSTKNRQSSGKSQRSGNSSRKQSSSRRKPQSSSTVDYDDQQDSAPIHTGDDTDTISNTKSDKDYDYENYSKEEEPFKQNCDKKKVYRTQIVIETS